MRKKSDNKSEDEFVMVGRPQVMTIKRDGSFSPGKMQPVSGKEFLYLSKAGRSFTFLDRFHKRWVFVRPDGLIIGHVSVPDSVIMRARAYAIFRGGSDEVDMHPARWESEANRVARMMWVMSEGNMAVNPEGLPIVVCVDGVDAVLFLEENRVPEYQLFVKGSQVGRVRKQTYAMRNSSWKASVFGNRYSALDNRRSLQMKFEFEGEGLGTVMYEAMKCAKMFSDSILRLKSLWKNTSLKNASLQYSPK